MKAKAFLEQLRQKVRVHVGVTHPLLSRLAQVPFTRDDYRVFGLQHFALVGNFTKYMEYLLLNSPDSESKLWIAKVLVDEYGEGSEGKDHAQLYYEYLKATGIDAGEEINTPLHEAVVDFIATHIKLCRDDAYLIGLGALGPGHEWSIPHMFPPIVQGLRRAGFKEEEIMYFTLHLEQDIDHGLWLEEALEKFADTPERQAAIERGAMLSLEARARFWGGVQDKIVRWRQPRNTHLRTQARRNKYDSSSEITLKQLRQRDVGSFQGHQRGADPLQEKGATARA